MTKPAKKLIAEFKKYVDNYLSTIPDVPGRANSLLDHKGIDYGYKFVKINTTTTTNNSNNNNNKENNTNNNTKTNNKNNKNSNHRSRLNVDAVLKAIRKNADNR